MRIDQKINNYRIAAEMFNNQNKDYKIECFVDFNFLNIYIHDLINEKFYKLEILNNCIKFYPAKDLLKQYYLLVEALFNDDIGGDRL